MALKAHTIEAATGAKTKSKRRGRGNASGSGNYSGRGLKGQRARSGGKSGLKRRGFKFLLQSTPKLRGFKSPHHKPVELSLSQLDKLFADGETVNLTTLKEKGVLTKNAKLAKVLGSGELKTKLTVEGLKTTAKAAEAIKKAGGEVK